MFGIQMVGTRTEQLWTIRNPNVFGIRAPTVFGAINVRATDLINGHPNTGWSKKLTICLYGIYVTSFSSISY